MRSSWRKKAAIFLSRRWATTRPVGSARLPRWRPEVSVHRLPLLVVAERAVAHRVAVAHLGHQELEPPAAREQERQAQLPAGARDPELARGREQAAAHRVAAQQRWA